MFNNQLFDSWLDKKSDEILSKVDREKITTEEMIILVLKAQTNHFHHADIDLKEGLTDVRSQIKNVEQDISELRTSMDEKFQKVDQRFLQMDQKIDNRFMWLIGITVAMSGGIYLKLFLS